jgi:CheY-like chemotaxis protein
VRFEVGESEIAIAVSDDGVGIEPALLPHIFDRFVQGSQDPDRASGGLGLGLAVVHALVDLHGGTVEAESAGPGTGSRFSVRLPRLRDQPRAVAPVRLLPGVYRVPCPRRILLVDDNDDARDTLIAALTSVGHEVSGAADPVAALELAQTFRPEVAVLDIGLPVMDGYELAVRLNAQQAPEPPQLIALTGYGQAQDQARSAAAGFAAHLVKPIDVRRLLESIESLLPEA